MSRRFSRRILARLRALAARGAEAGNATVEFVILFPAFVVLMVSGVEAGVLMTRQMMLERALDLTMRELRLGLIANPDHDKVKAKICDLASIIPDCGNVMMLELSPVSKATFAIPIDGNRCVDRTEKLNPTISFTPGAPDELMMVRACAVFDPLFPATGLGLHLPRDASGGYRLIATSAFVNEPG